MATTDLAGPAQVPSAIPATTEAVLALLAQHGFVVTNVFQIAQPGAFGDLAGWKAHLRNLRSTQVGSGFGETLEEALFAAFAAAARTPYYVSEANARSEAPEKRGALARHVPPPRVVILDVTDNDTATPEDLF